MFSLLAGLIVGALGVIFAIQNVAVVTVTFLSWQITAPLAFVLLGSMAAGVVAALLFMLPSIMRDEALFSVIERQKSDLENELVRTRGKSSLVNTLPTVVVTTTGE